MGIEQKEVREIEKKKDVKKRGRKTVENARRLLSKQGM